MMQSEKYAHTLQPRLDMISSQYDIAVYRQSKILKHISDFTLFQLFVHTVVAFQSALFISTSHLFVFNSRA